MAIAGGHWGPITERTGFAHREVVEHQAHSTDKASEAAPTARQRHLVRRFFNYRVVDINRTINRIRNGIDANFLWVEVAQCGNFALRTDEQFAVKLVAGQGAQSAAQHMVAGFGVAGNVDVFDVSLHAFAQAHLDVN